MSNPNPSRTTHRRSSFPATDPLTKSMDSSIRTNPLSTHFSKLGISKRSSRTRSPPPLGRTHPPVVVSQSDFKATQKPLSKSAIFEPKIKPSSQSRPQIEQTTVRVVRETKKVDNFPVKEKEALDLVKPMVRLGRSRSLCDPKVELASFMLINGVKLVNADMPSVMQIHAVSCARKTCDSLEKFSSKALALSLKKEFDGAYGPAWHCIVGTSFGSFVTHSVGKLRTGTAKLYCTRCEGSMQCKRLESSCLTEVCQIESTLFRFLFRYA